MKPFSLYYECQPFKINQVWGVYDPDTYVPFGFTDHNGIDVAHGHSSRLRAPFPYQIYRTLWQPRGGGKVLSIVSLEKYTFPDGKKCHVLIDYLHLEKYVKTQGQGMIGDLIAIAGNTGAASDGPHTHMQARRVKKSGSNWIDIDKNNANGSFNQLPYYNGLYAVDYKAPAESPVVMTDPNLPDVQAISQAISQAAIELGDIELQPEPQRGLILELWKSVLELFSRALSKG